MAVRLEESCRYLLAAVLIRHMHTVHRNKITGTKAVQLLSYHFLELCRGGVAQYKVVHVTLPVHKVLAVIVLHYLMLDFPCDSMMIVLYTAWQGKVLKISARNIILT